MIDPNGVSNEYVYDARGRMVSGTVLPAAEGDPSLVTQICLRRGGPPNAGDLAGRQRHVLFLRYVDRLNQIVRVDASLAKHDRCSLTYNAFDQASSVAAQTCTSPTTGACAGWTTDFSLGYSYSSTTSNLSQVTNADNTSKRVTYTAQGALATLNDENHTTGSDYSYTYDLAGRRLSEARVLAGAPGGTVTTQYAYDLHDNVTSVTDPNGNVTTYRWDDFDRVVKETSPVSGSRRTTYDPNDNLTSDRQCERHGHDLHVRRVRSRAHGDRHERHRERERSLDVRRRDERELRNRRLATMTDPSGSTAYSYDRLGHIAVENHNVAGSIFTYGYGYDVNGNRST